MPDYVYSSPEVFESLASKIMTQLGSLQSAVSTLDAKFTSYFDSHGIAKLVPNTVTFEIVGGSVRQVGVEGANTLLGMATLTVEFRVHTGFPGRATDARLVIRLLNSIHNWFAIHKDLGDQHRYAGTSSFESVVEFEESVSRGGQIALNFDVPYSYTTI